MLEYEAGTRASGNEWPDRCDICGEPVSESESVYRFFDADDPLTGQRYICQGCVLSYRDQINDGFKGIVPVKELFSMLDRCGEAYRHIRNRKKERRANG